MQAFKIIVLFAGKLVREYWIKQFAILFNLKKIAVSCASDVNYPSLHKKL